jgi:hypothetical protein
MAGPLDVPPHAASDADIRKASAALCVTGMSQYYPTAFPVVSEVVVQLLDVLLAKNESPKRFRHVVGIPVDDARGLPAEEAPH